MSHPSIPPYSVDLWEPDARFTHCVFIFVYNEGPKIRQQIERFPPAETRKFDIMIGNDGSTDDSLDPHYLKSKGIRGMVSLPENQGLSPNIKAGLHWWFSETRYQSIICMNGNNKDDPTAIPDFIHKLESGYDYVQGSRFLPGGSMKNIPSVRYWAIRWIHAPLFSLAARHQMTDTTNGFRAFSRTALEHREVLPFQEAFRAYELEQYLACRMLRLGMPSIEIPVSRDYPEPDGKPKSYSKIKPGIGYLQMIKPLLALNFNLYK